MGHDSLANHFKTNFSLIQHHKWSLTDIQSMMPWERYIYVDMLLDYIREEEQKIKDRENEIKAQISTATRRKL